MIIYKLSHGGEKFNDHKVLEHFMEKNLALIHQDTKKSQGSNFIKAKIGTIFYLCNGSKRIYLIGRFIGDPVECDIGGDAGEWDGWVQRKYEVIIHSTYTGNNSRDYQSDFKRGWTPNYNSTFFPVPKKQLEDFEKNILHPFFYLNIEQLNALIQPLNLANTNSSMSSLSEEFKLQPKIQSLNISNIIFYGPPGTGKTRKLIKLLDDDYANDEGIFYEIATFHQSYGYEDFVEGLRPVLISDNEQESENSSIPDNKKESNISNIQYEIRDGIFKRLCKRARKDRSHRYAMVIDEINRGNISKIFGELITLIEPCKREGGSEEVALTLPYSGDSFTVPSNVDIFGSMNTADRSLALFDTALRRRFEFISFYPDPGQLENITVINDEGGANTGIKLSNLLAKLNERIEVLYDRDHTIGHGYFFNKIDADSETIKFSDFRSIFEKNILPLLEEYFFEDREKIRLVLGDSIKENKKKNDLIFYNRKKIDLINLFGNTDEEFMGLAERYQYVKNDDAFSKPDAYIGIYAQG